MQKIVRSTCDDFYLTPEMLVRYEELKGCVHGQTDISRDDPALVRVVEEFNPTGLEVVEIPDDVQWSIEIRYGANGYEHEIICEKHREW